MVYHIMSKRRLEAAPSAARLIFGLALAIQSCCLQPVFAYTDIPFGQQLFGSSFGLAGLNATFDYVIVGGGNAGLVVAARLSEDPANSVAVVEAGSFYEISNGNLSQIPRGANNWVGKDASDVNPLVDWGFVTTPQKGALNQSIHYARGKTLGGSTGRNNMAYNRGTKQAHKWWAELVDDPSYEWDTFVPYIDRSVTFHKADTTKRMANATPDDDPAAHLATSGPVSITYTNAPQSFSTWALRALDSLGMHRIPGFIGGRLIGSSWPLATIDFKTQVRDSAETAYLRPAMQRPNLIIYPSTLGKRILFDDEQKKQKKVAVGVEVSSGGSKAVYTLSARKEVIVSAGVFQSPQLLMVSGIGPAETLEKFGIPVVVDLPGVGQGMWDHQFLALSYPVNIPASTVPTNDQKAIHDFLTNATGPLTSTGGEMIGYEKLPTELRTAYPPLNDLLSTYPADWPELEYISRNRWSGPPEATPSTDHVSITIVNVAPLSRGSVTISSRDTADPPVIDPAWLTHPADQALAIASVKRVRQLFADPALAPIRAGPEAWPGSLVPASTDPEILAWARQNMMTIFHAACTCKMGRSSSNSSSSSSDADGAGAGAGAGSHNGAVVDSRARVYGVTGLRVVDLSAFPILPPGHPMASVYGFAEKIAEDIRLRGR